MSIYEVILYLCLLLSTIKTVKNHAGAFYFMVFVLFVVAALRDLNVGVDTQNYYNDFQYLTEESNFSAKNQSEIVFAYITYFFRKNLNYDWYMLFMYSLVLVPIAVVIRKTSTNCFFSLFLLISCGFYTNSFNIMRQSVAISIMTLGFWLLERDKGKTKYWFWPLFILVYFIHNATLILAPLFFLKKINLSKKWMSCIVIASFIIGFFVSSLLSDFYYSMSELELGGRLSSYLEYEGGGSRSFITNFGMNLVFLVSLFFVSNNYKDSVYFKAFFISMIVFNFVGNMYYMTRLTFFYSISQVICIPVILTNLMHENKKTLNNYYERYTFNSNSAFFITLILGYSLMRFYVKELMMFLPYEMRDINLFNF